MGPSGSGKSTLFYILGGLDKADSGSVVVNGKGLELLSTPNRQYGITIRMVTRAEDATRYAARVIR